MLKLVGLPDLRFHDLRHTCATLALRASVRQLHWWEMRGVRYLTAVCLYETNVQEMKKKLQLIFVVTEIDGKRRIDWA